MASIRVLVTEDSAIARDIILEVLKEDPQIEIAGIAENGAEAVEKVKTLKPDLVTMDLNMPVMGGLEAIEIIMASTPVPILVLSSYDDASSAFTAVSRGALDLVSKSVLCETEKHELLNKIRQLAGVKVIRHIRPRHAKPAGPVAASTAAASSKILAIASSTGGPHALEKIFTLLEPDFPFPIVVAQHISEDFVSELARWLNTNSSLQVKVGEEAEQIKPGTVYFSPVHVNMGVRGDGTLYFSPREASAIYFPSCNYLLNSVAAAYGNRAIGMILTGMGNDGVEGMAAIKDRGGYTLGQDEQSSVIYGMPRVAFEKGCLDFVGSPESLVSQLKKIYGQTHDGQGKD